MLPALKVYTSSLEGNDSHLVSKVVLSVLIPASVYGPWKPGLGSQTRVQFPLYPGTSVWPVPLSFGSSV